MKKHRRPICILVMLTVLLIFPLQGLASVKATVTLGKKAGDLSKATIAPSSFSDAGIKVSDNDGKKIILNPFGENKLGKAYNDVDYFGSGNEYFVVTEYAELPNAQSLVAADGTVLVEHAAIIKGSGPAHRYATVTYATEEVSDKADCFLFSYKPSADIEVRLSPGDADVMYAGYSVVYDTQEKRFVENARIDDAAYSIKYVGDNIMVDYPHYVDKEDELYRPDGSLVGLVDSSKEYYGYFKTEENGVFTIKDENLKEVATLNFNPDRVYAKGTVFSKSGDDGLYHIVDKNGNAKSPLAFKSSPDEKGSFLIGRNTDSNGVDCTAVITPDGKTILDFKDKVKYISEARDGFFSVDYQNDEHGIVYPDGRVCKLKSSLNSDFVSSYNHDNNAEVFIFNKAGCTTFKGTALSVGPMMFSLDRSGEGYGLYSAADGSQLLPHKYRGIYYANGYVYADNGESYEIYPCTVSIN